MQSSPLWIDGGIFDILHCIIESKMGKRPVWLCRLLMFHSHGCLLRGIITTCHKTCFLKENLPHSFQVDFVEYFSKMVYITNYMY